MEKHKQENNFGAFLIGILIGGSAGIIAGLLLSPKSGTEIRKDISENVNDTQTKALQMIGNARTNIEHSVAITTKNIESTVNRVVDAFNAGTKAAKGNISEENIAKLEKNNISAKIVDVKLDILKNADSSDKVNEIKNFSEYGEVENKKVDE